MRKLYLLYKKLKRIDWEKGSGTIMIYICMMWLIVLSAILFTEYYNAFSHVGKSQLYADLVADGSVFMGNNGWGLDEKKATKAKNALVKYNKDSFKDTKITIKYTNTDKNGKAIKGKVSGKNKNNTVNATADLKTKTLTIKQTIAKTKTASSHITYSGGLRIVLEAYKHTYEYSKSGQTHYVWGGGHGIPNNSNAWENNADCSGFVSGVFRKCGYMIDSSACTGNLESTGTTVARSYSELYANARPGDIILIWRGGDNADGSSQHVVIYAGEYNGKHYAIDCRGDEKNSSYNPGKGASKGAHIGVLEQGASRIQVQRIVNTEAKAEKVPEYRVAGLSKDESVIYSMMKEFGLSDVSIAGFMGNFKWESGCNPIMVQHHSGDLAFCRMYAKKIQDAVHKKTGGFTKSDFVYGNVGPGYGLAQWTYYSRKAGLWNYASRMGSDVTDIRVQVSFALYEASTNYGLSAYKRISSPTEAAQYVFDVFEGAGDPSGPNRRTYAAEYYRKFGH